ncbi:MAG TPA: rRNA maturation RNase YbeY [Terriglobales bacterium]|nr:rRNA maturation RNase YbeY [Terriglobales bacterium]
MIIVRQSVRGVSASALQRFAGRARRAAGLAGAVNVLITTDRDLRSLNRRFRRKDKATDVLSFPGANGTGGDIAISAETAARNARRLGHSTAAELKVLILHGVLHLAGYDHERDGGRMARREQRLRREFRLPAGLIERNRKP